MKFEIRCKNCRDHFTIYMYATDRPELARRKGKNLDLKCKECGMSNKYHINELQAVQSRTALIVSLIILLAGPPFVFFVVNEAFLYPQFHFFWFNAAIMIGLPSVVFMLMRKNERDKVSRFNGYKVRED